MKMTNLENPSSERDPSSMPKINESERAGDLDQSDSETELKTAPKRKERLRKPV